MPSGVVTSTFDAVTSWAFAARGNSIANPVPMDSAPNSRRVKRPERRTCSFASPMVFSSHIVNSFR